MSSDFAVMLKRLLRGRPQSRSAKTIEVFGWLILRRRLLPLLPATLLALFALGGLIYLGQRFPVDLGAGVLGLAPTTFWFWTLMLYCVFASVLPVWSLLQPRDFLNSLMLYLGLGLTYVGFFIIRPEFSAPVVDPRPEGAPALFPFVFIVIACGAASGFHSLVSSGTTAKQLDRETDARFIGYGAMIGESLLGLAAILACTAGFASRENWAGHYASWGSLSGLGSKMGAFIDGAAGFVAGLGFPEGPARTLIAVMVVSFALTTLDSATRLLRYNIEEIGQSVSLRPLGNRYVSSTVAVAAIAFFAFYKIDGQSAGLALWQLFGSVNQLLAGLALLVVSLYLIQRGRPSLPYLMTIDCPRECQYTLGHYRPGSCVPYRREAWPCSKLGLSVEAMAVVGLVAIIP